MIFVRRRVSTKYDLYALYNLCVSVGSMRHFGWKYGYTATDCDWWKVTQKLYDTVDAYVRLKTGKQLMLPAAFTENNGCNKQDPSEHYK